MTHPLSKNKAINEMLNTVVENINDLAEKQLSHIESFTKIGLALSAETDTIRVIDLILVNAIELTNAVGATFYRDDDQKQNLIFTLFRHHKSNKYREVSPDQSADWAPIPLYDEQGRPLKDRFVNAVYHDKEVLRLDDVYKAEALGYDISDAKRMDREYEIYQSKSMITLPLINHEGDVLGILQVINAADKEGQFISFNDEQETMLKSLASQAAIALMNRKLIESLENLLMQFIRAIAKGIERKSKHSSAHITRVAELTEEFANKLNQNKTGKLKDVEFSPNELRELSMAGWMHDVGKIVTPVHIMDKGTKLETIIDRISFVAYRFVTMKTLIRYAKSTLPAAEFEANIKLWFNNKVKADEVEEYLDSELEFINQINQGRVNMRIGKDRNVEAEARLADIGKINFTYQSLHYYLIDADEMENLMIDSGTLLTTERHQMEDHVSATWDMLSQLTFPKKYANVAKYASQHHEKLNGGGYPGGLTASDIPIQSRIIAIADIFEALTAADRPYKKAKTLTESLRILAFCVRDGELDEDLVDFFLDSRLYREFAEKHMASDQMDDPDIDTIRGIYKP